MPISSGTRRLQNVDQRQVRVATEVQAIVDDEVAATTRTPTGTIDHRDWLEAELRELTEERQRLEEQVTVEGDVRYE